LRGRSDDWLRRLPAAVADAVRQAANDWSRRFDESRSERRPVAPTEGEPDGGRMSPVDFAYRTMGR
jgi:hypothetical protein